MNPNEEPCASCHHRLDTLFELANGSVVRVCFCSVSQNTENKLVLLTQCPRGKDRN